MTICNPPKDMNLGSTVPNEDMNTASAIVCNLNLYTLTKLDNVLVPIFSNEHVP